MRDERGTPTHITKPTIASVATWLALAALTVVGLALRLREAWQSMPNLVARTVPDDSFYYFEIARNIMRGHGATLDGETVTTGFHPLWLVLITPLFAGSDRALSVHLALSLGALLGALTIPLIFDTIRRLTANPLAALLGATFFALHPVVITYGVNGLETSLSMFTLAIVLWVFVIAAKRPAPRSTALYLVLGCACGFMILARIDTVLIAPAVIGYLAVEDWRSARRWRGPTLASALCAAWMVPWVLWSWLATGSPIQDSAVAGGLLPKKVFFATHQDTLSIRITHGLDLTRETFLVRLPQQFMADSSQQIWLFWPTVLLIAGLVVALPLLRRICTLTAAGLLAVPFSGLALALLYEAGVRWFVRSWYYAPWAVFAACAMGLAAHWLEGLCLEAANLVAKSARKQDATIRAIPTGIVSTTVFGVLLVLTLYVYGPQREGMVFRYPWQQDVYDTREWIDENTPADARIAAFNAGIGSYFWSRTVVNLDGVVNRDAYTALEACATRDYIRKMNIHYVIDAAGQFIFADCALSYDRDLEAIAIIGTSVSPVHVTKPKATP